jgi:enoyl-CoA hydratase/carnithine racemase
MTASGGAVLRREADGIAEVVLDRPDAMNALNTATLVQLTAHFTALAQDPQVRVVVLSSAVDRAFCVGADLKERAAMNDAQIMAQRPVFRAAFGALLALPQPAIAAVHGYALGGGCELALSCDVIVADATAQLGLPEASVGLVPGCGGTQLLARRVGPGRAADMIFSGRRAGADEAHAIGLADRLVPAGSARTSALELAATIAANSPVAVRAAKQALRNGAGLNLAAALDVEDAAWRIAAGSADRREGIAAFAEKRTPIWPSQDPPPGRDQPSPEAAAGHDHPPRDAGRAGGRDEGSEARV